MSDLIDRLRKYGSLDPRGDPLNELLCYDAADEIEKLQARLGALQAKLDAVMLEYCPDEMGEEQLSEWAKHQRIAPCPTRCKLQDGHSGPHEITHGWPKHPEEHAGEAGGPTAEPELCGECEYPVGSGTPGCRTCARVGEGQEQ